MLEDLMELQDADQPQVVIVEDAVAEDGLVFRPSLRRRGYHPGVLAKLAEHGLVDMTHVGQTAYRVYVTPVGRDCYDDMCGLT
jgi:capsular polysaccharide biosynthesis protein